MQISHSAVEKFNQCSESYRLHYIEKIRAINANSSFLWGSAIDEGLNELLKTKMEPPELLARPMAAFLSKWNQAEINGQIQSLKFCPLIEYSKKDLDLNLFTEKEYDLIKAEYPDEDPKFFPLYIESERLRYPWWSYAAMEENTKIAYNCLCWLSLAKKAEYIFEAYQREVLPHIKRVIAIQEEVALENDHGDTVKGFIDFIAEWDDGSVYILDNKTTSDFKYYKEGCVKESNQLSMYTFAKNLPKAGYIAILKDIKADGRKKGSLPTVKIKIRLDDIDLAHQTATLNKFNVTNLKIKNKEFKKLPEESLCMFYGKKCPYAGLCWKGSMEGLVKKEVVKIDSLCYSETYEKVGNDK